MSKILITGASGFIGSNLTKQLIQDGHSVIGVDNFSFGVKENLGDLMEHPNFHFIEGDVRNLTNFIDFEASHIIHLASQKIPRYDNAYATLSDNGLMTKNVIEYALKHKAKLIFASTSDVYGKNPAVPFNEESDLVMGPTTVKRWAYAISKMHSEQYIIACNAQFDLQYTIMRFFGSYGPNQNMTWWGGPQSVFIEKALKNETIEVHGDGKQTRTFTYVDDTVQGIIKCALHPNSLNDIFNIAGDPNTEITIHDLATTIWEMIRPGEQPKIDLIPYSSFGNYEDVRRRLPCIDKICSLLDYSPQWSMKTGLEKAIEWQRKMYTL